MRLRLSSFLILMSVFVLVSGQLYGQSAGVVPKMPKNPKDQMLLAAKVNGLGQEGAKPWHLKASYQTFDADGNPKGQGTFEEWWAAPDKYKVSFSDPGFHQVLYRNSKKTWITGDTGVPPFPEWMIWHVLNHPLPKAEALKHWSYLRSKRKFGSVSLNCILPAGHPENQDLPAYMDHIEMHQYEGIGNGGFGDGDLAMACLDPKSPMLRLEAFETGWLDVLFNQVVEANGYYSAKQIDVKNNDVSIAQAHVESVEFPGTISDEEIAPPSSAKILLNDYSGKVNVGLRVRGKDGGGIFYPPLAKKARIQGLVIVEGTITKSGVLSNLRVMSGPAIFRNSVIEQLKSWRYKPTRLDGRPVAVQTLVDVVFKLGN